MKKRYILPVLFFPLCVFAKDLGTIGDIWEIQEQNLLSLIDERLKEQFEGKSEEEIQEEVKKHLDRRRYIYRLQR